MAYIDLGKLPLWSRTGERSTVYTTSHTTLRFFATKLRTHRRGIVVHVQCRDAYVVLHTDGARTVVAEWLLDHRKRYKLPNIVAPPRLETTVQQLVLSGLRLRGYDPKDQEFQRILQFTVESMRFVYRNQDNAALKFSHLQETVEILLTLYTRT